jgi:hypothetical protein
VINFSIFLFAKVLALTANVKKLASDVSARSCPGVEPCQSGYQMNPEDCSCTCNLTSCPPGNLYNYQTCECTYYPVIQIAYDAQHALKERIKKLSRSHVGTSKLHEYKIKLAELEDDMHNFVSEVEYDYSNKNKDETEEIIKEYQNKVKEIISETDDVSETTTRCTNKCDDERFVLCNDCKCRKTDETEEFRDLFEDFADIEGDIFSYKGAGSKSDLKEFRHKTKTVRHVFEDFLGYLVQNNGEYDAGVIGDYVKKIKHMSKKLKDEFEDWKNKNSGQKCNLAPCGASEVADMRACKCVYIKDYDQLQGIADKYQQYVNSIKALNLDETNTATFMANL